MAARERMAREARVAEAKEKKEKEARLALQKAQEKRDPPLWAQALRELPEDESYEAILAALRRGWYEGVRAATETKPNPMKYFPLSELLNYAMAAGVEELVVDYVSAQEKEGLLFLHTSNAFDKNTCMKLLAKLAREGRVGAWAVFVKMGAEAEGPSQRRSDPNLEGEFQAEGLDWSMVKEAASRRLQSIGLPQEDIDRFLRVPLCLTPRSIGVRGDKPLLLYLAMLAVGLIGVNARPDISQHTWEHARRVHVFPVAAKYGVLPQLLRLESTGTLAACCLNEEALATMMELARGGSIRAEQVLADALARENLYGPMLTPHRMVLPFVLGTLNSQFALIPASTILVWSLHIPPPSRPETDAQIPKEFAVDVQLLTSSLALGGVLYGMWLRAHRLDGPDRRPPAWAIEAQRQLGLEAERLDVQRVAVELIRDHEAGCLDDKRAAVERINDHEAGCLDDKRAAVELNNDHEAGCLDDKWATDVRISGHKAEHQGDKRAADVRISGHKAEHQDDKRAADARISGHKAEHQVANPPLLVLLLRRVVGEQTKVLQTALANKYAAGANPVTEELLEVVRRRRQGQ